MKPEKDASMCQHPGCTIKPKNGNTHCWKHKNRKQIKTTQQQLSEMSAKVGLSTNKRVSNFGITINPNKNADDTASNEKFLNVLLYLYKDNAIRDFIRDKFHRPLDIKKYEVFSGTLEIGRIQHRTNHHALIRVEHNNTLMIDIPTLREFLAGVFGHDVHINIESLGDTSDSFQNYAEKNNINILQPTVQA